MTDAGRCVPPAGENQHELCAGRLIVVQFLFRRPGQRIQQPCPEPAEPEAERQARRDRSKRLDLARHLRPGYHGLWWTEKEKRMLGTLRDNEVAARTGRTPNAVRIKREALGLLNPESRAWTAKELALLGTATDGKVAKRIGRRSSAVAQKQITLGIPLAGAASRGGTRRGGWQP
jgi:hypothetical protein